VKHTVVVGAGIHGLGHAHLARCRGHHVTLVESGATAGGVLTTTTIYGVDFDHAAQSIALTPSLSAYFHEWGIDVPFVMSAPQAAVRCIHHDGQLHRLTSPASLITSSLLPVCARLALPYRLLRRVHLAEDPSIADAVRAVLGPTAVDAIAKPIVAGIYAGNVERLSFSATFGHFADVLRLYPRPLVALRRMPRQGRQLAAVRGGMHILAKSLAAPLHNHTLFSESVVGIDVHGTEVTVQCASGRAVESSKAILAVAPAVAATLVRRYDAALADRLTNLPHASLSLVHVLCRPSAVRRPLQAFGVLMGRYANPDVLGIMDRTTAFPDLYTNWHHHVVFVRPTTSAAAIAAALHALNDVCGIAATDTEHVHHVPWIQGIPQPTVGHYHKLQQHIEAFEQRFPMITLAGAWRTGVGLTSWVQP